MKIRDQSFSLVFAEGLSCELTWENLFQENQKTCASLGFPPVAQSTEEFKVWQRSLGMDFWWDNFIDGGKPIIIGIDDDQETCHIINLLANLNCPQAPQEECVNAAQWLNYTYRDPVILAKIVLKMHEQKNTSAALVLGQAHIASLQHHCKEWGIKLIVAEM